MSPAAAMSIGKVAASKLTGASWGLGIMPTASQMQVRVCFSELACRAGWFRRRFLALLSSFLRLCLP
jgi:hypothetical protein